MTVVKRYSDSSAIETERYYIELRKPGSRSCPPEGASWCVAIGVLQPRDGLPNDAGYYIFRRNRDRLWVIVGAADMASSFAEQLDNGPGFPLLKVALATAALTHGY